MIEGVQLACFLIVSLYSSLTISRLISSMQRYLALDDRIAWSYYEFPEDLFSGESVEEWITLSGKQGEGLEGNINISVSLQLRGAFRKWTW